MQESARGIPGKIVTGAEMKVDQVERERQVLATMVAFGLCASTHASVARCLNLVRVGNAIRRDPCDWAPVLPPPAGKRAATVPDRTRRVVGRVLERLVKCGLLAVQRNHLRNKPFYSIACK